MGGSKENARVNEINKYEASLTTVLGFLLRKKKWVLTFKLPILNFGAPKVWPKNS